jgi:ATP-dependent protease ClpP protease subunit
MPREPKSWYEIRGKQNGETEIAIDDEIGAFGVSAKAFRSDIKRLGEKEPIHVHINSDGGSITEGNEIFNILRDHKGPVRTSVGAIAASMATVIACAGKPLSIAENGFFMIHNPWTITMGDSEELRKNADVMDKMKAGIIAAYRQKSHLSEQEISDLMDEETWMTAEEALEKGFVDSIDKTDGSSAKNFDLSKFRNSASFLSRLQHEHKARGKRAPKVGTPEGKVTLQDLENATHPEEETPPQPPTHQPQFAARNQLKMTPEEEAAQKAKLDQEIKAKADELYKAKLKRDQEIDEVVLAVRKRDKKDFGNLAAKFKQEDKNAEQFALAVSKSDDFKPFEVIGEGDQNPTEDAQGQIRVIGLRGIAQGSVGERFIQTDAFKSLRDRVKAKGRGALERNTSVSQEINDVVMGNFLNSAATPTSTGLTSIDKQAPVRGLGLRELTVKDLLAGGTTNATTIRYIREVSFANEADVVAEAAAKPEALFEFAEVDAPVRKIAAYVKMPDELIADYAAVASFINMRLPYKVERKEEDELLNGSGSGQHITGLLNTANIQTQAKGADTRADAIFKAITNVRFGSGLAEGGWAADGIVVNPLDWENLRLAKDGNNQYFGGGPFTGAYGNGAMVTFESLWGKPVAITPAIAAGTALVGAFRIAAQYFQRQGMTIEMTNSDQDDFIKNRVTVRAEERLALCVYNPPAFCQVTGL